MTQRVISAVDVVWWCVAIGSMWALEYFHNTNTMGGCNVFGLPFECCVANGNQGWPKFTHHLFANGGVSRASGVPRLLAAIHAPASLSTQLDDGTRVSLELVTDYPFGETLTYTIRADARFEFSIRIPRWAEGAKVTVHPLRNVSSGATASSTDGPPTPGSFHVVPVAAGTTRVVATFPFKVRVEPSPVGYGGVTVHAGPLIFALDLAPTERQSTDCYYPPDGCYYGSLSNSTPWRTALLLDQKDPSGASGLRLKLAPGGGLPFASNSERAWVEATVVDLAPEDWPTGNCTSMESGCHSCVGPVPKALAAPRLASMPRRKVSLIPFGATDIRIAVLPVAAASFDAATFQ